MEKTLAVALADLFKKWSSARDSAYEIETVEKTADKLQGFHQWANGKPLVDGFRVSKRGEESYYLLFIDWHRNDNYYLAIYLYDKSTTVAEIQRVVPAEDDEGGLVLTWKYNPLKRDGKNDQRKAYFQQTFGSTTVQIPLPQSPQGVESFLTQLFALSRNRLNADRIVTVFDLQEK